MTIHTDDFALPAGAEAPRVVSAAATSAREEALERAQTLSRTGIASAVTLEQRVSAAQGADGRLAAAADV